MVESSSFETSVSLNAGLTPSGQNSCHSAFSLTSKARNMSRVLLATALGLAVTGCSQGSQPLTAGLADGTSDRAAMAAETRRARQGALGGHGLALRGAQPSVAALVGVGGGVGVIGHGGLHVRASQARGRS